MSLFNNSIMMGSSAAGAYEIERSLRFNNDADTATLTRTFSSAGNRKTWTFSCWVKRGLLNGDRVIFNGGGSGSPNTTIRFDNDNSFNIFEYNSGYTYRLHTNRLFRDLSAWYHIVVTLDTTQGTADNRIKLYVNGVQETSFANRTNPSQDTDYTLNNNIAHTIGNNAASNYFSGYLTEINFVDGTALAANSFGKTDTETGQWIPKKYGGSHGTNGFYLNFSDNSNTTSGTLGDDDSANTNDWTPNNFSVAAGLDNDSFEDTPTNNWCTLNPNKFSADDVATFANGNLKVSQSANGEWQSTMGTIPVSSGKWYYEVKVHTKPTATTENWLAGFHDLALEYNNLYYGEAGNCAWGIDANNPEVFKDTDRTTGYGSAISDGDILQFALDVDAEKFWVGVNNTWTSSGDPAAGSNPSLSSLGSGKTWIPKISMYAYNTPWGVFEANFGAQGFSYTPPTDFKAINAANALPEPIIKKGTDYYGALLWTGNDAVGTRLIDGLDFNPDLHILKTRTVHAGHWGAFDSVRGVTAGKETLLNAHTAEGTEDGATYGYITPGTGGFTYNTGSAGAGNGNANYNWVDSGTGATYIAYNWKESATAGFDIVAYTGTGSATTVSHSLGVAPELIVVKNLTDGASVPVSISGIVGTGSDTLYWGTKNNAASSQTVVFPATLPTSSVFSVGTHAESNASSKNYIAYLWTSVAGYSKLGIYTGNGNSDGPFIYTGFKPAFLLIKCTSNAENWNVFDAARDPDNYVHHMLVPNNTAEENNSTTARRLDFTCNGIKMRGSDGTINTNNYTYLYMAFAESPFKYSNAR